MQLVLLLTCAALCCWTTVVANGDGGFRGLSQWQPGQNAQKLREKLNLPGFSGGFTVTTTNPITKQKKSLSVALAAGGAEAETASIADDIEQNGIDSTVDTFARALSDGRSAAVAISFARASIDGGEEADAAAKVLARTFGRGNPEAIASAMGQAYNRDGTAVATTLADAIVRANNGGSRRAVAEATAEALANGGNQAQAFSRAYSQAVSDGKCDQVAEAFAEAVAIADDEGQGSAVAASIAEADADVADCVFRKCDFIAQGCCNSFSISRGKCFCRPFQGYCNWNLLTKKPFPIWETDKRGWARNRYCKCK